MNNVSMKEIISMIENLANELDDSVDFMGTLEEFEDDKGRERRESKIVLTEQAIKLLNRLKSETYQTTETYFKKSKEELNISKYEGYTLEDCLILDDCLRTYFFDKEENLKEFIKDIDSKLTIKTILKTTKNKFALLLH